MCEHLSAMAYCAAITYLSVAEVEHDFEPNIRLVVIRRHRAQKRNVNIFIGKGSITRGYTNNGNLVESTCITDRCR